MFYEEKFVEAGRKEKECYACKTPILIGQSSYTFKSLDYLTYHVCLECSLTFVEDYKNNKFAEGEE
jgi:hypothetical protein